MPKNIQRKIKTLAERLNRLGNLAETLSCLADYQKSADTRDIAERNLQLAIEACLDIGKIIISAKDLREPPDNKGVFIVLAEAGYLSQASLTFMIPMAGTRNILVHGYDRVDEALVYGILKRHTQDFHAFLHQIKKNYLTVE